MFVVLVTFRFKCCLTLIRAWNYRTNLSCEIITFLTLAENFVFIQNLINESKKLRKYLGFQGLY